MCKQAIARPRFRCFALALWASALSVSLLCTRCSRIRVLFSEPPCFSPSRPRALCLVSEPDSRCSFHAARVWFRDYSLLSSSEPAPRSLLRVPCSLLSSSEPRSRGALASYSARTRECERLHSRVRALALAEHSRVRALALAVHSRVRALVLAHFPKTLACESHLTCEWSPRHSRESVNLPLSCTVDINLWVYFPSIVTCTCTCVAIACLNFLVSGPASNYLFHPMQVATVLVAWIRFCQ